MLLTSMLEQGVMNENLTEEYIQANNNIVPFSTLLRCDFISEIDNLFETIPIVNCKAEKNLHKTIRNGY